jgi:hypothetical protein
MIIWLQKINISNKLLSQKGTVTVSTSTKLTPIETCIWVLQVFPEDFFQKYYFTALRQDTGEISQSLCNGNREKCKFPVKLSDTFCNLSMLFLIISMSPVNMGGICRIGAKK